jgi:hypothetical protein
LISYINKVEKVRVSIIAKSYNNTKGSIIEKKKRRRRNPAK